MKDLMTVSEFDRALHAGLGRCVRFLCACGDREPYRESVLQACFNDYAYDGQSEGTRAWYTYSLLSCFNDDGFFFSCIQHKLREVICRIENNRSFEHLFDLALEFARHDYAPAKGFIGEVYAVLLSCLADKTPERDEVDYELQRFEHICIEATKVGGISVFTNIAADLGGLFSRNAVYSADDFCQLIFLAEEWLGKEFNFTLMLLADVNDNIATYLQSVEQSDFISLPAIAEKEKRADERTERAEYKDKHDCDVDKILSYIKRYDNTDPDGDWHAAALDIMCNEATVFPIEAYMYVYTGLCACCRYGAVKAMHRHGLLTDNIIRECLCDCYDETRKFAERLMQN